MESRSVNEVYERNDAIRGRLNEVLGSLNEEQFDHLPHDEKWTITNVVEHVAVVESNMIRICAKLLGKAQAEGKTGDGSITNSASFKEKAAEVASLKLEAPDFVQPTCKQTIDQSLEKMNENRSMLLQLKSQFEKFDSTVHRFPHPFFGDLSAAEWLMLIGGHKARHIKQIEKLAEKR
ncbi:MAG: DinB family protein [Pyrinomonadaceae bacterium]